MATAVKVDDAKSRLEELQAEIRLQTGQNVTQQDLLSRLIDDADESREEGIDSFHDGETAIPETDVATFFGAEFDSGVETDEEDIDDILYG